MLNNNFEQTSNKYDIFKIIENIIKDKESIILLFFIICIFIYIPFKILSLGWTPSTDTLRHVAFSTLDKKWSDILVIDNKFDTDHNSGWHKILKFLYKRCNFSKDDLMLFSVVSLFLLVNITGILISPQPICWCLALLIMLNFDDIYHRMILGRPYLVSCTTTLIILRLWGAKYYKEKDFKFIENNNIKFLISLIAFSLGVWIHGSWYIFLLIPISFFLAGKTLDAIKLTIIILLSTILGAALTGDFLHFLYYHFVATFTIYSESTYNWLLVTENATGHQSVYWAIIVTLIIFLCKYKNGYKLKELGDDPIFIMVLLCWLGSIFIIRFWIDWGRMSLLIWLSYRLGELISKSASLNNPRIRYSLCLFILVSLTITYTNDANGRYTKSVFTQPVDFYNESTSDKIKSWAPENGGVIYSNRMGAFYQHFYKYPNENWKYILGFESAIMTKEDKETLREINYTELEEAYTPWINKMTEKDRLILTSKLYSFPQLEWIKGNRLWWIGRLKRKADRKDNKQ